MKITTDFLIGKTTSKSWVGVFGHKPDMDSQIQYLGEMFAVMSLKSEIDFSLEKMAGLLQDELHASYFQILDRPATLSDLETALRAVNKRIKKIMDREPELAELGIDFEMLVVIIREDTMYVGVVGESKLYVARGDDAAEISGVMIDSEMDGFARTGSLKVEADDRILLLTSDAFKSVGTDTAETSLQNFNLSKLDAGKGSVILLGCDLSESWFEEEEAQPKAAIAPVELPQVDEEISDPVEPQSDLISEDDHEEGSDLDYEVEMDSEIEDEDELYDDYYDDEQEEGGGMFSSITDKLVDMKDLVAMKGSEVMGKGKDKIEEMRGNQVSNRLDDQREGGVIVEDNDVSRGDNQVLEREIPSRIPDRRPLQSRKGSRNSLLDKLPAGIQDHKLVDKGRDLAVKAQRKLRELRHGRPGTRADRLRNGRYDFSGINRKWVVLGAVLVVALIVVVMGVRQTILDNERREYEEGVISQVNDLVTQMESLSTRANVASIGERDEIEISNIVGELGGLQQAVTDLKSEGLELSKLDKIIEQVDTETDALLKINAFSQPQIVADLALSFQGVNAANIEYQGGQLYVADAARNVIYRMNTSIQSKVTNFATGLDTPSELAVDESGNLVFYDQGSESVIGTIDTETGRIRRQPGLSGDKLKSVSSLFIWKNNAALYMIDQAQSAIVKLDSISGNYQIPGAGTVWRKDAAFANAVDIAVNGSVYVLSQGHGLKRYWGGQPAGFRLEGLLSDDLASTEDAVAFELTSNKIYIADAKNNRILIFTVKNAAKAIYTFTEQIVYRGDESVFTDIRDIVVVPGAQGERLFVLDGARVIRIDR